jgi:hypothetical protein
MALFSQGVIVYGFEQSLNSRLHPPFMVFFTQVMVCELILQSAIALAFYHERNIRPEGS